MGNNLYRSYCVKCNNIDELKSMLNFGVAGLPYISEWAIQNLENTERYPVYVSVKFNERLGMILGEIAEESLSSKCVSLVTYNEFILRI